MSSFADFADAMATPRGAQATVPTAFARVAVLGGGTDGALIAALALAEGCAVTLFTAYGAERQALAGGIALRGAGPVGSYQTDAEAAPSIRTTADLDQAVDGADLIVLTGPVHKQRTYAMVLADHLADGQVLAIAPGRTFAALETRWLLSIGGCRAAVEIAEGPLPYWVSRQGSVLTLSAASGAGRGVLPGGRTATCAGLGHLLPGAEPKLDTMRSSFADGSGLVEVPTLVLGGPAVPGGGPAIPMGATALPENDTFRNLIGARHADVIGALAHERIEVARGFGVRDLPDAARWTEIHAGAPSGEGARPVPAMSEAHAILRDAVIGSLVPLTSAARLAGVATPATDAMIALASTVLGADLATAGRALTAMGVGGADPDTARRALEDAVRG